jgi:hypothetical protein
MFKLKEEKIFYDYCYSEYLIEKFPKNFFDFHIDIGACGVVHPWHINHMGNDNDNTTCIGFEPEENFFEKIDTVCKNLPNVHLHKSFFGKDKSLKEIVDEYNITDQDKWCFSCDCEGDEKYIFNNIDEINILKKAEHIAFEIHPSMADITYEKFVDIFKTYFNDTHKIIRTYHGGTVGTMAVTDNSSFILTKLDSFDKIIKPSINNFKFNWSPEHNCMVQKLRRNGEMRLRPAHAIHYIN